MSQALVIDMCRYLRPIIPAMERSLKVPPKSFVHWSIGQKPILDGATFSLDETSLWSAPLRKSSAGAKVKRWKWRKTVRGVRTKNARSSSLRATALLVEFHFVLEPVVQFEVVVLQRSGWARWQAVVRACAVEEEAGTDCAQEDAQWAHDDDGDQDGVQGIQPGVVFLRDARHWRLRWRRRRVPLRELQTCGRKESKLT